MKCPMLKSKQYRDKSSKGNFSTMNLQVFSVKGYQLKVRFPSWYIMHLH